jgi:hypothetical protein
MMMMMKGVAVIAALGLMGPSSMVSADDEFACAPEGKMKKVQLTSFSMEGTFRVDVDLYLVFTLFCSLSRPTTRSQLTHLPFLPLHLINRPTLYHVRGRD